MISFLSESVPRYRGITEFLNFLNRFREFSNLENYDSDKKHVTRNFSVKRSGENRSDRF